MLRYLGLAYYGLQRYTEAARVLENAAQRDPENATTWLYLGLARYGLGQYSPAAEALERAERLDPDARTADVARRYREILRNQQAHRTAPPAPTPRRWSLSAQGGIAFEVTAASVQNPFKLRELEEFTCPGRL